MSSIRIVAVPPGFAPLNVREDWLDIVIPLATKAELTANPLSGLRLGSENLDGYLVLKDKAIIALEDAGREQSACYWASLPLGEYLEFRKDVCKLISGS